MHKDESRFVVILEKHLANNATAEEVRELLLLIKSGRFDKLLKQRIDGALQYGAAERDISPEAAQHLLYKILRSEERTDRLIPGANPFIKYRAALATAAAVLLVVAGAWLLWPSSAGRRLVAKVQPRPAAMQDTGKGRYMRLPDGSTVLLRGGSQLVVGTAFNTRTREVTLTGEAYFDIHAEEGRPFIVHAKTINTTVLGTAFNVRAWPGQSPVVVTVTRGKVSISDPHRVYGVIGSDEQIAVNALMHTFVSQRVDMDSIVAWKKDYLVLDDISLTESARLIGDKYHVHIVLANDALKGCRISATFLAHESLEQVLGVVCGVIDGTYKAQPNDQIIIDGKGCN